MLMVMGSSITESVQNFVALTEEARALLTSPDLSKVAATVVEIEKEFTGEMFADSDWENL